MEIFGLAIGNSTAHKRVAVVHLYHKGLLKLSFVELFHTLKIIKTTNEPSIKTAQKVTSGDGAIGLGARIE